MCVFPKGLNKKKPVERTVLVTIYLSKAINTDDHKILIKDIAELPLNSKVTRFLVSNLRG